LHFDLLEVSDLFGEISHVTTGQFTTFTTGVFLRRKQQMFFMPLATETILHSLRVWSRFIRWPTAWLEIALISHGCFGTRLLCVSIMIQTEFSISK